MRLRAWRALAAETPLELKTEGQKPKSVLGRKYLHLLSYLDRLDLGGGSCSVQRPTFSSLRLETPTLVVGTLITTPLTNHVLQ